LKPSTPNLVSVLLTTHNSTSVLEACLESVFRQSYPVLEFIIVDNASVDATRDLLKRFEHRARVICGEKNVGFAAGMNQAMEEAGGAWLLSLNPDVILSPDFISKLVAVGEANP
jgi:N-acetylglucosaminyl-diphospho-decaprenol L-rhamnosyltransferase